MRANLEAYGGPVMMIAITPPGKHVLPWNCPKDHEHRKHGCKVKRDYADVWAAHAPANWKKLREDARIATLRATGIKPTLIERVWEPQKRGVPHLHIVLGMGSELEKVAAHHFLDELEARSREHNFGFVQLHRNEMGAREAARYLVGYLLGRSRRKGTIRENIADPRMPRSLIWLTPRLTSHTLVTMRRLRYARWYFAARARKVFAYPQLRGQMLVDVANVCSRIDPRRAGRAQDDEPPDAFFAEHFGTLVLMRRLAGPAETRAERERRELEAPCLSAV